MHFRPVRQGSWSPYQRVQHLSNRSSRTPCLTGNWLRMMVQHFSGRVGLHSARALFAGCVGSGTPPVLWTRCFETLMLLASRR